MISLVMLTGLCGSSSLMTGSSCFLRSWRQGVLCQGLWKGVVGFVQSDPKHSDISVRPCMFIFYNLKLCENYTKRKLELTFFLTYDLGNTNMFNGFGITFLSLGQGHAETQQHTVLTTGYYWVIGTSLSIFIMVIFKCRNA